MAKAVAAIVDGELRNVRLFGGDAAGLLDWLPPASLVGDRSPLSRPVAEEAPLEAPLRQPGESRPDGAGADARRRSSASPATSTPMSSGRCSICRPRADFDLDSRAGRRLAAALFPVGRAPATRRRRSRRAASRPISRSSACDRLHKSFTERRLSAYTRLQSRVFGSAMISQKAKYAFKALVYLAEQPAGRIGPDRGDRRGGRRPAKVPRAHPARPEAQGHRRQPPRAGRRLRSDQAPGGHHHRRDPARHRRADRAASLHLADRLSPLHGLHGREDLRRPPPVRRHLCGDAPPDGRDDARRCCWQGADADRGGSRNNFLKS